MASFWGKGIPALIYFSFCLSAQAADCPDFERIRAYYAEMPSVSLSFLQLTQSDLFASVDSVSGTIWAGWGGRFRLSTPHQILVSNGTLFWSYSVENKQVLIDSIARMGKWNPLVLLYDPEKLYSCGREKKAPDGFDFELAANDTLATPRTFDLQVASDGLTPRQVTYDDDNDSHVKVFIKKFARRKALPDTLFEFHTPPGVEVIKVP